MLSVSREASNSRSLNGIISIEDGNGTTIENGIITANSIQVQQQLEIEGDLVCEDLVASGDIECLDLVASGDIGCVNITVNTNLVSSTSSIGTMTSNFLNVGELQVGSISNVENTLNAKANVSGATNNFTNANFFSKTTYFKSFIEDGIYYGAMIITNPSTQGTGTSLCLISGETDRTALNVDQGNVIIDDNLKLGSINDIEDEINGKLNTSVYNAGVTDLNAAINLKVATSTYNSGVTDLNDAINLKVATSTYASNNVTLNTEIDKKAKFYGYQTFQSFKNANNDSFQFSDWQDRSLGALVRINGTTTPTFKGIALQVTAGLFELGTLSDVETTITTLATTVATTAKISGTPNGFTNVNVFNKPTYFKSYSDDGIYYGAMVITNSSTQGTGTNLCVIRGDTDRTALNVEVGDVIIEDNLKVNGEIDSPVLVGTPTSTTPDTTDNSQKIATTAFVKSYVGSVALQVSITSASVTYASGTTVWKFPSTSPLPDWTAYSWIFTTPSSARTRFVHSGDGPVGEIPANNSFILMTGSGISQLYKAESSDLTTYCRSFPNPETYKLISNGTASVLTIGTSLGAPSPTAKYISGNLSQATNSACPPVANQITGRIEIGVAGDLTGLGNATLTLTKIL